MSTPTAAVPRRRLCIQCGKVRGHDKLARVCTNCRDRFRCKICGRRDETMGTGRWCDRCKGVVVISDVHRSNYAHELLEPWELELRIDAYTKRAEEGLPLFD
jgi:hypothetical protein